MKKIKNIIGSSKRLLLIASFLLLIKNSIWRNVRGDKKIYPKVLQLPLTYRCNSRCVMCNVWNSKVNNEFTVVELEKILKDSIFKNVKAVGINGGEPSLVEDLELYVKKIIMLPSIETLTIISNGFNKKIISDLKNIYKLCRKKNITFSVTISLDGYGKIHEKTRRVNNAFDKALTTIEIINKDREKFCDSFEVAATVVRQNVDYLIELDTFAKKNGLKIKYRLGVGIKRIGSDQIFNQYSLSKDQVQTAREFFYGKIFTTKILAEKFKYFAIYSFLSSNNPTRLIGCSWKDKGITLDSLGNIYYCAVKSKKLGSLFLEKGENIFFSKKNIKYRTELIKKECVHCIHDYTGKPEVKNIIKFFYFLLKTNYYSKVYKIKSFFIW